MRRLTCTDALHGTSHFAAPAIVMAHTRATTIASVFLFCRMKCDAPVSCFTVLTVGPWNGIKRVEVFRVKSRSGNFSGTGLFDALPEFIQIQIELCISLQPECHAIELLRFE
jgi:hypothetical protein